LLLLPRRESCSPPPTGLRPNCRLLPVRQDLRLQSKPVRRTSVTRTNPRCFHRSDSKRMPGYDKKRADRRVSRHVAVCGAFSEVQDTARPTHGPAFHDAWEADHASSASRGVGPESSQRNLYATRNVAAATRMGPKSHAVAASILQSISQSRSTIGDMGQDRNCFKKSRQFDQGQSSDTPPLPMYLSQAIQSKWLKCQKMKIMRVSMEIKRSAESGFCAASQSKLAFSIAELLTEVPEHPDQKGHGQNSWNDDGNFTKNAVHKRTPARAFRGRAGCFCPEIQRKTVHPQKTPHSISAS